MSQSEQSSSSSHSSRGKKKSRNKKIPLMDPIRKVKVKTSKIVINLSMTHYDVITDVAEDLQWTIQYGSKKGDWDVLWVDHMIEADTLIKMHFFQKISHFPGIYVLARKNLLGMSFNEMSKKFPEDYNFFPRTWLLPDDFSDFRQEIEKRQQNNDKKCYIVKPQADCQGRGIFLTFQTDSVQNGKHYVVQQYLQHPFLVQGLKFDFRVYVLLCGTNPMRLYVYEQGLARFATEKYQPPSNSNIKKMCMHLTNYAINKKNPKYIFNTSVNNMNSGHKRTLTSIYKYIERRGLNIQIFKDKLDDVLVKTIIMGQPLVSHQYKFAQPDDQHRNMCFHILGVDVMIDEMLDPYVIQVNHTPSFATDTPLDYFIKFNLIKDTLILMNINKDTKKKFVSKTNSYQRQRVTNVKRLIENQEQRQKIRQAQAERDEYENRNLGKYRKIYPVSDEGKMQKYAQFLKYAEKTYFSENNVIRAQIDLERQKYERKQKERERAKAMSSVGSIKNINQKQYISSTQSNLSSPIKFGNLASKKNFSSSERQIQIEQRIPSTEFFLKEVRDIKIQSIFRNNQGSFASHYSTRLKKTPVPGFVKIARSINSKQMEEEKKICNRINFTKNLPKIQHALSPSKKNSTLELKKENYVSLRKKKIAQFKDQKLKQLIGKEKGSFLTPKMIRFTQQQEQLMSDKPIGKYQLSPSLASHTAGLF